MKGVLEAIRGLGHTELKACFPRDLVNQVCWAARYEDKKPLLDHAALTRAVEAYFLPNS
jgi:hypothetical protein